MGRDREALEVSLRQVPEDQRALRAALRRGYEAAGWEGILQAQVDAHRALTGRPCAPFPALSAQLHAQLGHEDEMFRCLEEAVAQRRFFGLWLKVQPQWDPYRDDPRFTVLLRRMNLAN
jgi:hypothetical protein